MQSLCFCSATEINKCIKLVDQVCKEDLEALKQPAPSRKRKGKSTEENEDEGQEKKHTKRKSAKSSKTAAPPPKPQNKSIPAVSGIVSMLGRQNYLKTKQYNDYVEWREAIIDRLRNE